MKFLFCIFALLLVFPNQIVFAQDGYEFQFKHSQDYILENELKKGLTKNHPCDEYDLINKNITQQRLQGETGFCWAYALSDLISIKIGTQVSAIDIGLTYVDQNFTNIFVNKYLLIKDWLSLHSTRNNYLGGISLYNIEENINNLKKIGVCLEEDFIYSFNNDPNIFIDLENLRDDFTTTHGEIVFNQNSDWIKKLFPNITFHDLKNAAMISEDYNFIHNIALRSCRRIHFNHIPLTAHTTPWEVWKSLVAALNNHSPIVIGNESHARIVVGQKNENGICKVKIKDSAKGIYYENLNDIKNLKFTVF